MKYVRALIFLLLVGLLFTWVEKKLAYKTQYEGSIASYFRHSRSYDVIAVGPSYIFNTISPAVLQARRGLSAYVLGTPTQPIEISYYLAEEAMKRSHPKVLIVGATMFAFSDKQFECKDEHLHNVFDLWPLSYEKLACLYAVHRPEALETYLVPFEKYHGNWKTLDERTYRIKRHKEWDQSEHGHHMSDKVYGKEFKLLNITEGEETPLWEGAVDYLDRFQALAERYDAKLLLLTTPLNDIREFRWARYRTLYRLAHERGIPLLDLNKHADQFGLVVKEDFQDLSHLNTRGAHKASRFLADYIAENLIGSGGTDE